MLDALLYDNILSARIKLIGKYRSVETDMKNGIVVLKVFIVSPSIALET